MTIDQLKKEKQSLEKINSSIREKLSKLKFSEEEARWLRDYEKKNLDEIIEIEKKIRT